MSTKNTKKRSHNLIFPIVSLAKVLFIRPAMYTGQRDRATCNGFVTHFLSMSVQYH